MIEKQGFNCFVDRHSIEPGSKFHDEVQIAIRGAIAVIAVLSRQSLCSQWVFYELGAAAYAKKEILPYLVADLDQGALPTFLSERQVARKPDDLARWLNTLRARKTWSNQPPEEQLEQAYLEWWDRENSSRDEHRARFLDFSVTVASGVFSPEQRLTHSTFFTAKFMRDLAGKTVLDIGTGTGVLAIHAARLGARSTTAVDIDGVAARSAAKNVRSHKLNDRIRIVEGDLFGFRSQTELFPYDVVVANLPIAFNRWTHIPGDVSTAVQRFLRELPKYMAPGGYALLPWASFGDPDMVKPALEENNLRFRYYEERTFGVTWQLFQISHPQHHAARRRYRPRTPSRPPKLSLGPRTRSAPPPPTHVGRGRRARVA
jgi:2-polyprenyl-3-methyl-5-hydroxy-6-metoxy-1,4-benzoquinol methylase